MKKQLAFLSGLAFISFLSMAQHSVDIQSMERFEGLFNFYHDAPNDRILLEVPELEKEFLYVHSLSSGVGHNDLALDRGQLGGEAVVYFKKAGNRLLLVQPNLRYRALSENKLEQQAVEEAFARSVLYSFEIVDETGEIYLVDLSDMLFSDAHYLAERLSSMQQGNYAPDRNRSGIALHRTKAFPENVEFDIMLTFSGQPKGSLLRSVTPDAHSLTVNQHHSFVKLPDNAYKPRIFHPQSGCFPHVYMDYSTPVYEPIIKRFIVRHRLEKKYPDRELSEAVEPIIYYLDHGTPEPMRSALLEGGRWWEESFREIGFKDAFRVEMLPEGADPMDVRYNVIQWVHRSTRGWSYGASVVDPRSGEIIKGHVSLGSLRVRQDFMIAQALLNHPFDSDEKNHQEMMDFALARIRQLSAHEIGHTLGFTHNFAASSNNRSSVMDYPHPLLHVEDGEIHMDEAYDEGIGDWDKVTIKYAYSVVESNEDLEEILEKARDRGLRFISDNDARAPGGAHPHAHLWDNGNGAIGELEKILEIRSIALDNFSEGNIREGEPLSVLEDVFVPLYFFHRYQLEAVSKLPGGLEYAYSVKGDGSEAPVFVDPEIQKEAIKILSFCLSPEVLMIPEEKLGLFPPRAYGYDRTAESFKGQTGITFDALAPAASSANFTLELVLHPERVNRMLVHSARDVEQPGPELLISSLLESTILAPNSENNYEKEVRHTVNFILIDHLNRLSQDEQAYPQTRAIVKEQLEVLKSWLENEAKGEMTEAYRLAYIRQIESGKVSVLEHVPAIPPGSPIGMDCM